MIAPDYETQKFCLGLAIKLDKNDAKRLHQCFFRTLREKMENYYDAELTMKLENSTPMTWGTNMAKLTKYEKETIVLFNEGEDTAYIQIYNLRRMKDHLSERRNRYRRMVK